MDLRQLKYFTRIVELESLTAAAQSLHVAQPSLSQHVANLEQELGVRLLDRGARGAKPTAAGRRLYEHAKSLLRQAADTAALVRQEAGAVAGHVKLGLPASTSRRVAVPLLQALRARHPALTLEIVEGSTAYIAGMVQAHQLDLGVVAQVDRQATIALHPLLTEELLLIGPPDGEGPGDPATPVSLATLCALPLLLPAFPNAIRVRIEQLCNAAGLPYRLVAESAAAPVMTAAAQAGLAWTILPWAAVEHEDPASLRCLRIEGRAFTRHLSVGVAASAAGQPACAAVREVLVGMVEGMVGRGEWRFAQGLVSAAALPSAAP